MPQYNTTGIVLRRLAYGETDNILTLYTLDRGRVSAIAKGARKAGSRLTGASETLACSKFSLSTGKNLETVVQAEVKNSFPGLRKDLIRLAHGQYMAELLSHFVAEDDPHPGLFTLLRTSLLLLERVKDPEVASRWFELRLLEELGYAPDLRACAVCGNPVPGESHSPDAVFGLTAAQGGALCEYHARPREIDDHSALSFDALDFLQHLEGHSIAQVRTVAAMEPPHPFTATQARLALRRYIRYRCDSDLKSVAFLDSLGA
jgi:DNA repair protein RecO (recombination protein O)